MELKIIDAGFFLCAFESDSERIPRSSAAGLASKYGNNNSLR
jgi:hypothetical protein